MPPTDGPPQFRGLLECPLRSGFVEFEFQEGDTVGALLKRVEEVWGVNFGWTHRKESSMRLSFKGSFGRGEGWIVGCEDTEGSYVLLTPDHAIPTRPPTSGKTLELPVTSHSRGGGWRFPGDVEHGVYNIEAFGWPAPSQHVKIAFKRDYQIPKGTEFEIRLLALAAVSGG